jgi:hypothetical protein
MPVPSQESEQSCICVLELSIFLLSRYWYLILDLFRLCNMFCFFHLLHKHDMFVTQKSISMCVYTAWIETKLYKNCFLSGGGNRSTQRKPPTCCKLLTIFITVIGPDCVRSCKSRYRKHTNTMARIFLYSLVSIHAVYTHILIDFWVTNISW